MKNFAKTYNMAENNINLLKQIFWKLWKEKNIEVDIKQAEVIRNDRDIGWVVFKDFSIVFNKESKELIKYDRDF